MNVGEEERWKKRGTTTQDVDREVNLRWCLINRTQKSQDEIHSPRRGGEEEWERERGRVREGESGREEEGEKKTVSH